MQITLTLNGVKVTEDAVSYTHLVEDLACMLNETASATAAGSLPDAGAQLRACFVAYGPAQVVPCLLYTSRCV